MSKEGIEKKGRSRREGWANTPTKRKYIERETHLSDKIECFLLFFHSAVPLSLSAQFSQSHSVTDAHLKVWNTAKLLIYISVNHTSPHSVGPWHVVCSAPDKAGRGCPSRPNVWSIRPFSFFPNNRPIDDLMPFLCLLQPNKRVSWTSRDKWRDPEMWSLTHFLITVN